MKKENGLNAVVFPWSDTRVFAESLKSGQLSLPTAISQFNAVCRETFRIIEEVSSESVRISIEAKSRVDKMDKLINDLTEKCQAMQQALLYKEEKYDEKCREVERYKVICELSSRAAITDDLYYTDKGAKHEGQTTDDNCMDNRYVEDIMMQDFQAARQTDTQSEYRRRSKSHVKLSQGQVHLSNYIDALKSPSESQANHPDKPDVYNEDIRPGKIASHYLGGPCKRKPTTLDNDMRLRGQLASIGGINVSGSTPRKGPVPINKLLRPDPPGLQQVEGYNRPFYDDINRTCKISLSNQSNEIMSSSKNIANQMMQKFTERDLHRQVASGCYTRLSSRRKKEWPF